jgi:chemotaxis protein methyltransferase CheR
MNSTTFEIIASLLRTRSGLELGPDKQYLFESRLAPLLRENQIPNLEALANRLCKPSAEALISRVVELMTTNETQFFRDRSPFIFLRSALLELHAARPKNAKIRIWSAATASGQEAYSIAMTVAEMAELKDRNIEILGTDISLEQIARAQEGLYSQFEIQRGLPMQMLAKYFRKEQTHWRVIDQLRRTVRFQRWNLLDDLKPLGVFDIVFCRNVLLYFSPGTKQQVLEAIALQLAPDGVLFLGGSETVIGITDRFAVRKAECGAYSLAPEAIARKNGRAR